MITPRVSSAIAQALSSVYCPAEDCEYAGWEFMPRELTCNVVGYYVRTVVYSSYDAQHNIDAAHDTDDPDAEFGRPLHMHMP